MTNKENIVNSIDQQANATTSKIAKSLTEKEATKLAGRIDNDINSQKGATPITTIIDLKRTNDVLSYKLRFTLELWGTLTLG